MTSQYSISFQRNLNVTIMRVVTFALLCLKAEAQPIVFSPLPPIKGNEHPLVMQLATKTNCVAYRSPVEVYARLINRGQEQVELPLDSIPWGGIESKLKWTILNHAGKRSALAWTTGFKSPHFVLMPGESVTIKLHDRLFPPGTNTISAMYTTEGATAGGKQIEVESNTIQVIVVEKPLGDEEKMVLNKEYAELTQYMQSSVYESDERLRGIVKKKFLVGSPYSVPYLRSQLLSARSPTVRSHTAEILGDIANREKSAEFGFHRDTSAADAVLGRLEKEDDPLTKQALLQAIFWFSDAMDLKQRSQLQTAITQLLDHPNEDVRFWAAFDILRVFPENRQIVKERLANFTFVRETIRPILIQRIKAEDEKRREGVIK